MATAPVRPAGRLLYSLLTGEPDDEAYDEDELRDFATITSVLATRLAARAFAGPDDVRIGPFVRRVAKGTPAAASLAPLIRAALRGWEHVDGIAKAQLPGQCVLLIATLLIEAGSTRDDLARLIAGIDAADHARSATAAGGDPPDVVNRQ